MRGGGRTGEPSGSHLRFFFSSLVLPFYSPLLWTTLFDASSYNKRVQRSVDTSGVALRQKR